MTQTNKTNSVSIPTTPRVIEVGVNDYPSCWYIATGIVGDIFTYRYVSGPFGGVEAATVALRGVEKARFDEF